MEETAAHKAYVKEKFRQLKCCVIIPTYNNAKTIEAVIQSTLEYCDDVIVINDGCTDNTASILSRYPSVHVVDHGVNKGKGMALRNGFSKAVHLGFTYVISIDSDGQHFPKDFILFLNKVEEKPGSLIIGARNMTVDNVPNKSTFGNKFSNFWFWAETGISLPDTQSGFRLYPVQRLKKIWLFTTKFELEIEVIVKAAWRGIPVISVPVNVYYAPQGERVSHFIPSRDSTRISFLNTYLVVLAALFWRPVMILRSVNFRNLKNAWRKEVIASHETSKTKALSVGVGLFFGIVPIWGFQFALAIFTAVFFKLNKVIVGLSAQISVPPLIPFVLYASIKTGEFVLNKKVNLDFNNLLTVETLSNLYVYYIGATILSIIAGLAGFLVTWALLKLFGYKDSVHERRP
ncbi:MAG: b-glycosyltransferase, glycosyltransferase family 2 protein [Bacteroidota bacterium]|jgi:glycosyltransferase involved in cell wall biosynthesis|nr:b-glycosyltransferase, glycosyltransferase family 2 protein [Bacteroidota bacterium]